MSEATLRQPSPAEAEGNPELDAKRLLNEAVREAGMLVDFSASKWSASTNDRNAEHLTREAAGATRSIGRVYKDLLAGHNAEYKALCSQIDAARGYHYEVTLPWTTNERLKRGARLLPNIFVFDYIKRMNEYKNNMMDLLEKFIVVYEERVEQAKSELGSLANGADYPTADSIRSLFGIYFTFSPVPMGSDFRGVDKSLLNKLSEGITNRVAKLTETATKEACNQMRERLEHLKERLSDEDKRFHDTLVENAVQTARLLKGFNITKDPDIERIRAEFEQAIITVSPNELRKDKAVRASLASEAERLLAEMDKANL